MNLEELLSPEVLEQWNEAFAAILNLISKAKMIRVFGEASFVENVAKRWRMAAMPAKDDE